MIKRPIKYFDLDGNELTDDFYFNLNKSELAKIDLQIPGGLANWLRSLNPEKNPGEVLEVFELLISRSVGWRSDNGKTIVKTKEYTESFVASDPYDKLFDELINETPKAVEFIIGIFPKELQTEMVKHQADVADKASKGQTALELPGGGTLGFKEEKPFLEKLPEELMEMSKDQFDREFAQAKHPVPKHVLLVAMKRREAEEDLSQAS